MMTMTKAQLWGRYLGLALVSGGVLALQVTFTRIFSIMIWHHFTYLVIGVALLGGGVAGTFLAVRQKTAASLQQRISWLALGFSLCILVNLLVISNVAIDPLRMRQLPQTLLGLAIYFSSLFATFFMGGLTIAAIFSRWVEQSHRLYFADMLGASISTLAVIGLIQLFGGPGTIALIACLVGCAGLFLSDGTPARGRWLAPVLVAAQFLIFIGVFVFNPIKLPVPESKELGWAMRAQQAEPEYTRWNPVGRVDVMPEMVVQEPKIVGAVSSVYFEQRQSNPDFPLKLVTIDGTSMTGLYQFDGSDTDLQRFNFLENAVISAPYHIGQQQPSTLLIGVGGGLDILLARLYEARKITAIELNADIVQLLRGPYASYTGNIATHPTTDLHVAEGRSFLMQTDDRYDIIQGIGLDNLAALSGGAYVLAESYIYTVDSLEQSLNRLTPDGVFSWTRDVNEPPREMLRLTGLAAEALRRQGVSEPHRHIAIVANESGQNATLLVRRSPFTPEAIQQLRTWAAGNRFTMLQDPLVRLDTAFADYLHAADPRAFEQNYTFHIFPVSDDNPFFYNYFKWSNLHFNDAYQGRLNKFPIGNIILLSMFSMALVTAVLFIVFPLLRYRRAGLQTPAAMPVLVYFSLLGAGYIAVQIILIQRFTLFIGYPTQAVTTIIASMLAFSALGSLLGQRFCHTLRHLQLVLAAIAALVLAYIVALPPIFAALLHLPDIARMVLSAALVAPLAMVMGIPFPTALRRLGEQANELVPWAWGMNGIFSVLGSVLVIMLSMTTSFTIALVGGSLCYGAALLVSKGLWQAQLWQAQPSTTPPNASGLPAGVKKTA